MDYKQIKKKLDVLFMETVRIVLLTVLNRQVDIKKYKIRESGKRRKYETINTDNN